MTTPTRDVHLWFLANGFALTLYSEAEPEEEGNPYLDGSDANPFAQFQQAVQRNAKTFRGASRYFYANETEQLVSTIMARVNMVESLPDLKELQSFPTNPQAEVLEVSIIPKANPDNKSSGYRVNYAPLREDVLLKPLLVKERKPGAHGEITKVYEIDPGTGLMSVSIPGVTAGLSRHPARTYCLREPEELRDFLMNVCEAEARHFVGLPYQKTTTSAGVTQ